jgi:hypothetical protein
MRESRLYGSVRGDRGSPVPYRGNAIQWKWTNAATCPCTATSPWRSRMGLDVELAIVARVAGGLAGGKTNNSARRDNRY